MPRNPNYGFYSNGERTFFKLQYGLEYDAYENKYLADERLPVKFFYPWKFNAFQPAEIVIPKGHIVALCPEANLRYQREYMQREMRGRITIANGGSTVAAENNALGGTYDREANVPMGVVMNNVRKVINGTFQFGYPTIAYRAHLEVPFFAESDTIAKSFNWPCAYNANDTTLYNGKSVMSDENGKFVPWDGDDADQRVGKITEIDRNLPIDFLGHIVLEVMASQAGITKDPSGRNVPAFNPYNMIQPTVHGDMRDGDTEFGTRDGDKRTDHRKPYQYYPSEIGYKEAELSFLLNHVHLLQLSGLPVLHDGVEVGKRTVTEVIAPGSAKFEYDAQTRVTSLKLDHTMIQRDDKGAIHPDSVNPNASKLTLTTGGVTLTGEGQKYAVLRQSGEVLIADTNGNETWTVVYTHLEEVEAGVPSNLNFNGVVGAARILVSLA